MKERESDLAVQHIKGQALAYFAIAILFTKVVVTNSTATARAFQWDRTGLVPMPEFRFPNWVMWAAAFASVALCAYFVAALFQRRWITQASSVARFLWYPTGMLSLLSFTAAWLAGIGPLIVVWRTGFHIFFFAGYLIFLALCVQFIWSAVTTGRKVRHGGGLATAIKRGWTRLRRWVPKRKSCLDCGYLAFPVPTDNYGGESLEPSRSMRANWRNGKMLDGTVNAVCYRNLWSNRNDPTNAKSDVVLRGRLCSKYYPYSGGSPGEHAESHRARTNRRWLVAGGFLGPYVATSIGFIASDVAKIGNVPSTIAGMAILGLVGLALAVWVVNVTLNRT